ncbi:MAG: hypothetical protein KAX64_00605 [Chromatiaceae bacterium]|nr:hypothetical protein [Chromatiaceae bacterium]
MSGEYLIKAWDAHLPARQKLVFITLGDWADWDGRFDTDINRLSVQCGMSAAKTNRRIIRLVDKGFVRLQEGSDYVQLSGTIL